jgi:hypothetical protein
MRSETVLIAEGNEPILAWSAPVRSQLLSAEARWPRSGRFWSPRGGLAAWRGELWAMITLG